MTMFHIQGTWIQSQALSGFTVALVEFVVTDLFVCVFWLNLLGS